MDQLSKSLHSYLVKLAYEGATHEQKHQMEHLFALLLPEDEESMLHYYGLFGHQRLALDDIAQGRGEQPEETIVVIGKCIRKLAVTPEWQMIKSQL